MKMSSKYECTEAVIYDQELWMDVGKKQRKN